MTTRREVLRCGLALPALSLAAGSLPFTASAVGAAETLRLERFVYDVRFAESAAMGEHAARRGISPAPIADDLMRIWYDDLDLRWREQPMALAGITMAEALFVLETFALDRGMHVVYRGEPKRCGLCQPNGRRRCAPRLRNARSASRRAAPPST
jgi:hypothetical protein